MRLVARLATAGCLLAGVAACPDFPDHLLYLDHGQGHGDVTSEGVASDQRAQQDQGTQHDQGARADRSTKADLSDLSASCDPVWRCSWTLSQPDAQLTDAAVWSFEPVLPDCLTLYFASQRQGGQGDHDIWKATRASPTEPFGSITNMVEFNTSAGEERLVISADRLEAIFNTNRPGGLGLYDIWSATRAASTEPFGEPAPIVEVNSAANEYDMHLSRDRLRLYFATPAGGGDDLDLMMASRPTVSDAFSAPVPLAELNTPDTDDSPALSADELFIVFASERAGGIGGKDLWYASRVDRADPFGPAQLVPVVNTAGLEGEAHLACDDGVLWFVSDRLYPNGSWQLFSAAFVAP